jgi:septal ring factor EnvC (AmiA/AmiB activator)
MEMIIFGKKITRKRLSEMSIDEIKADMRAAVQGRGYQSLVKKLEALHEECRRLERKRIEVWREHTRIEDRQMEIRNEISKISATKNSIDLQIYEIEEKLGFRLWG